MTSINILSPTFPRFNTCISKKLVSANSIPVMQNTDGYYTDDQKYIAEMFGNFYSIQLMVGNPDF